MGKEYEGSLSLASKGIFYDEDFEDVHTDTWGSTEERLILSPSIDYETTVDRLIKKCTNCPIPPEDLLLSDRQHLFFFMRCLSYGGSYKCSFQCENCGEPVDKIIDLEKDISVVYPDDPDFLEAVGVSSIDEVAEPFSLVLPKQEKKISWRMLRGKDERAVENYVRRKKKRGMRSSERVDYTYRLALRIVAIDDEEVGIMDAIHMVESMKGRDILEFRRHIEALSIGMDPEIPIKCSDCGYENGHMLRMDKSFFLPPK